MPYKETFELAGINYELVESANVLDFGRLNIVYNLSSRRFAISDISGLGVTGTNLGLKVGDELVSINGENIDLEIFGEQLQTLIYETKPGSMVEIEVARLKSNRRYEFVKLRTRAVFQDSKMVEELTLSNDPSDRQRLIRNAWIGLR